MAFPEGWLFRVDGDPAGRPTSLAAFEAHLAHWDLVSADENEIVFNNASWRHYRPQEPIATRRFIREGSRQASAASIQEVL